MGKQTNRSPMVGVRNALRPFFKARKNIARTSQFQTIRQSVPLSNLDELYRLTEHNSAYRFPGMGNTFPEVPSRVPDVTLRRLTPLPLGREVALHVGRLNHHAGKLSNALLTLADINDAIRSDNWTQAESLIQVHWMEYGSSLAILRKDLLASFQLLGLTGLSRRYAQVVLGTERTAWALIAHITYDLTDPAISPERATRKWLNVLGSRPEHANWYVQPALSELLTCWPSKATLADALLRYSGTSLVDLVLCLWKAAAAHPEWSELKLLSVSLRPELLSILRNRFDAKTVSVPLRYSFKTAGPSDLDVFRTTFFFQEDAPIARWRTAFMRLLYPQFVEGRPNEASAFGLSQITAVRDSEQQDSAGADAPQDAIVRPVLESGVTVRSTLFLTSVTVASMLRQLRSGTDVSPKQLIRTLTRVVNIHDYVDSGTIIALLKIEEFARSPLLVFLLRDMLFRQDRAPDNELDRRIAFMAMFSIGGRHKIVPFVNEVFQWSPRTARYLARLCTRNFVERLYLLVDSVKEVLETRIALCEWFLVHSGGDQETIREERDALERELANLDARSDLDSTRVHVDEDSLREWYNQTQRANELRYKQTVIAEGASSTHSTFLDFYNRSREQPSDAEGGEDFLTDSQIGSEFILLSIFEATLRIFVTDKTFGLDSYLSRRIRHGTLRGFLTTPIARIRRRLADDIEKEDQAARLEILHRVASQLDNWFSIFAERLDHMRREVIQIVSDRHPGGLIQATWQTPRNVRHLDAMMARTRARVLESNGDYDIFSDVFLLCWDFLERDLANLRLHLYHEFYREIGSQLAMLFQEMNYDERRAASEYWGDIGHVLNGRVQEVCGWFIRPVFRRDAYDLRTLVESTVSIVRELDETYRFQEQVDINHSLVINRGSFDVLGDILFVLIGNAAKHGKRGGLVKIAAEPVAVDSGHVGIEVTSEVENTDALVRAEANISKAKDASDLALVRLAGVIEGFSGIRKVIGLLGRIRSAAVDFSVEYHRRELIVRFRVVVPSSIAFARERT